MLIIVCMSNPNQLGYLGSNEDDPTAPTPPVSALGGRPTQSGSQNGYPAGALRQNPHIDPYADTTELPAFQPLEGSYPGLNGFDPTTRHDAAAPPIDIPPQPKPIAHPLRDYNNR